jgi:hypothetical protein
VVRAHVASVGAGPADRQAGTAAGVYRSRGGPRSASGTCRPS